MVMTFARVQAALDTSTGIRFVMHFLQTILAFDRIGIKDDDAASDQSASWRSMDTAAIVQEWKRSHAPPASPLNSPRFATAITAYFSHNDSASCFLSISTLASPWFMFRNGIGIPHHQGNRRHGSHLGSAGRTGRTDGRYPAHL